MICMNSRLSMRISAVAKAFTFVHLAIGSGGTNGNHNDAEKKSPSVFNLSFMWCLCTLK